MCNARATPLRAAPTTSALPRGRRELTATPLISWGSSNVKTHEGYCGDRRDQPRAPEGQRDAVLRPTLVVERVVDRGHGEDASSAGGFEVSHLNDDRQRLEYKHESYDRQEKQHALLDGHRGKREADRQRTGVAHEDARGIAIENQECDQSAAKRPRNQLLTWLRVRQQERNGRDRDHGEAGCQAVHSVSDVHRVGGPNDGNERHRKYHPWRRWYEELWRTLDGKPCHRHRKHELDRKLQAGRYASCAHAKLAPVIGETYDPSRKQAHDRRQRASVVTGNDAADDAKRDEDVSAGSWGTSFFLV